MLKILSPKPVTNFTVTINPRCENTLLKHILYAALSDYAMLEIDNRIECANSEEVAFVAHLSLWQDLRFEEEEPLFEMTEEFDRLTWNTLLMHHDKSWYDYFDVLKQQFEHKQLQYKKQATQLAVIDTDDAVVS